MYEGEDMRIGAYQFPVGGNVQENCSHIENAMKKAHEGGVSLLAFPECALTGYPPHCIRSSSDADSAQLKQVYQRIRALSEKYAMNVILGTITGEENARYNSALVFHADGRIESYEKRALWGWDRDNFLPGKKKGIVEIQQMKIGIRICFEVRFPEYFRELYKENTVLNIVLFYDTSPKPNEERYALIKGHLQTRAVENVCCLLSVNATSPCQTAPTAFFGRSGEVLRELTPGKEDLLVFDFQSSSLNFGELGRKEISDRLLP